MANKNAVVGPNKSIPFNPQEHHQLPLTFQKKVRTAVARVGAERIEHRGAVVG